MVQFVRTLYVLKKRLFDSLRKCIRKNRKRKHGSPHDPVTPLRPQQASSLERPYPLKEIKEAIFSLALDKAPGSDGFSMAFFQECGI